MRAAFALALVAACGRIGIDPVGATSDAAATPDGSSDAFVACPVDGVPCDDGNICTTTSTCMSGVCVGSTAQCRVAESETEYTTVQGADGWYYGYWEAGNDTDGTYDSTTEFLGLVQFPGQIWRPPSWQDQPSPDFTWAYLHWWGGHPGSYPVLRIPIRRWVSDVSGRANAIVYMDSSDTGGDGTRAILVVNGVTVFSRDVLDGEPGFTETLPIDLTIGTTVDLLLHPIGDDGADTSSMSLNIESR